jgi:hypothetical protein
MKRPGSAAAPGGDAVPASPSVRVVRSALIGMAVFAGVVFLNVGSVPGIRSHHLVPAFLLTSFALAAFRWLRRGVREEARSRLTARIAAYGGGLYGTAALATWAYLEGMDLYAEVVAAGSTTAWVAALTPGWLVHQLMESLVFGVMAALWPFYWFLDHGIGTALAIGVAVGALDALAPAGARWLARRRDPTPDPAAG